MKSRPFLHAGLLLAGLSVFGCATMSAAPVPPSATPAPVTTTPPVETQPPAPPPRPAWVTPVTAENLAATVAQYHPNELGKVLILEYHHFGDTEERWTRTWSNFRHDLETLYAKGYRAVNLKDYLAGTMKLPVGTSPVIFTFDDSPQEQFAWKDGGPALQSAVGIMLQFEKEHPDFGHAGTFYVNFTPVPFGETDTWKQKIQFLVDNGFEVANHTSYHDDLSTLTDAKVQEALGSQVQRLRAVLPDYDGDTLALPFGIWPKNHQLAVSGEYQGVTYHHKAVLLVGAEPAPSLYDQRFDPMNLPRVQAIDSELKMWLSNLDTNRYISDGDPDTMVVPESAASRVNPEATKNLTIRTYTTGS